MFLRFLVKLYKKQFSEILQRSNGFLVAGSLLGGVFLFLLPLRRLYYVELRVPYKEFVWKDRQWNFAKNNLLILCLKRPSHFTLKDEITKMDQNFLFKVKATFYKNIYIYSYIRVYMCIIEIPKFVRHFNSVATV